MFTSLSLADMCGHPPAISLYRPDQTGLEGQFVAHQHV